MPISPSITHITGLLIKAGRWGLYTYNLPTLKILWVSFFIRWNYYSFFAEGLGQRFSFLGAGILVLPFFPDLAFSSYFRLLARPFRLGWFLFLFFFCDHTQVFGNSPLQKMLCDYPTSACLHHSVLLCLTAVVTLRMPPLLLSFPTASTFWS